MPAAHSKEVKYCMRTEIRFEFGPVTGISRTSMSLPLDLVSSWMRDECAQYHRFILKLEEPINRGRRCVLPEPSNNEEQNAHIRVLT